jgi:hypothetical protein
METAVENLAPRIVSATVGEVATVGVLGPEGEASRVSWRTAGGIAAKGEGILASPLLSPPTCNETRLVPAAALPPTAFKLVVLAAAFETPTIESKSGGGDVRSSMLVLANARASGPYGTPKRAILSRLLIIFSCSGVGPLFG